MDLTPQKMLQTSFPYHHPLNCWLLGAASSKLGQTMINLLSSETFLDLDFWRKNSHIAGGHPPLWVSTLSGSTTA